jgi:transcriptional antiterminator NusG
MEDDFSNGENVGNSIYALKTSAGQEKNVARMLAIRTKDSGIDLTAIIVPESLKGYILVESSTHIDMKNPAMRVPHLRGLVESRGTVKQVNTISFEEVKKFLKPEPIIHSIMKGSIVELVTSPFKGEKAKIMRIDESREEVVLELIEATVPIPVTVKADQIRIIQKEAD